MTQLMKKIHVLPAAVACALLAGCVDYTVETTVRADGTGFREIRVEATDVPRSPATRARNLEVTHLSQAEGWTHSAEVEPDGDTVFVFHKRMEVTELAGWSRVSGSVVIDGTSGALADQRVGYVRLGDVRFRNEVRVGRGRTSDGTTTLTYAESYFWDHGMDVLVEFFVQAVGDGLQERYPRLTAGERGQLEGAFRTRMWMAVDAGIMEEDADEDALLSEAIQATAAQAVRVLRTDHADVTPEAVAQLIEEVVTGEAASNAFTSNAPGADLALNTHIVFRLALPGRVTSHNADREEDGVLIWDFGPDDALLEPVEIRAESVVEG